MLPRAGSGAHFCTAGGDGLAALLVGEALPVVLGASGLDTDDAGGGLVVVMEGGKKAPGRGGDSGGVAADPVEPEPVLEKLQVRMRCCCCDCCIVGW